MAEMATPDTNTAARGLIVMDIDSTLINEEVIDLLGEEAGVGDRVAQITERAMRGELDFREALAERVGLLAGLDESVFDRTFARVTFTPGALELVEEAHRRGWKVGVVSGGFHQVADKIVAAAGIDYCLANQLEIVDGRLTGKVISEVVTKESKVRALHEWADELGLSREKTVAMGDGANDIPMILEAGTGIAFCAQDSRRRSPLDRRARPHARLADHRRQAVGQAARLRRGGRRATRKSLIWEGRQIRTARPKRPILPSS